VTPDGLRQIDLLGEQIVKDGIPVDGMRRLTDAQVLAILEKRDRTTVGLASHEQVSRLSGRSSRTDPGKGYPWDILLAAIDYHHPGTPTTTTPTQAPLVPYPGHQHHIDSRDDHHVEQIQKRLKQLGHYTGPIDESFGPATRSAVIAFQRSKRLTADGFVGPKTWAALAIRSW
jgi:N-acetyl-anhydromuramyl-L-alanine amidase AmpD